MPRIPCRSKVKRAVVLLLGGLACSCGLDGLFLTTRGFDPAPEPRAGLSGRTKPLAAVEVMNRSGVRIASGEADERGDFLVSLPPGEDGASLRVLARAGAHTTKIIVPDAPIGETTPIGELDARTTARAQLATFEILEEAGSTFAATPPRALAGLLAEMEGEPTEELLELASAVAAILDESQARGPDRIGPFDIASHDLDARFFEGASRNRDLLGRYRTSLSKAALGYALEIRCDPSRLNVMFAVDVSGRGLDGNGAPQLIRQPTKEGRVYLGLTSDESSPLSDESIPRKLTPNDPRFTMFDDGQNGDEVAGDGIFTIVTPLPRSARILYKYTNGAAGEGFTGTEEWPGNARILEAEDVLTGRPDGEPDCLVVRRDTFGDESTNKNFVNLHQRARERGGTVTFDTDLGGIEAPIGRTSVRVGGLSREDPRAAPPITPLGVPEARENGVCASCPAPLVLDPDDADPPRLIRADRVSVDRVRVRFSEPIHPDDARVISRYLYLDDDGRSVPIVSASPSGADVVLAIAPTHPRRDARLRVRDLKDASVRGNLLDAAEAAVGPDLVPPKVVSVRAMSIFEVEPERVTPDPTVGDLVQIVFDERPEPSAATDVSRYHIDGLEVLAAALVEAPHGDGGSAPIVRLVTSTQGKGVPYSLRLEGIRDPAGNALEQEALFEGFGLYHATFAVVPGFAYRDAAGVERGIPRGEKLYLTGTPLSSARALDGRDISVVALGASRTDVTGWPSFEMKPSGRHFEDRPIYEITLLLPRGSWAWKAAHGVEGEYVRPPPTLEKVYKTLATANDGTGVRIDPVSMRAANGVDYRGALLSESGDEPPRANVVFKREAPDEVCEVQGDVQCPMIVIGAWRDLVLDQGGRTRDYDDGVIALPPHRPTVPDFSAPKLLDARARDSFSILLSFDESLTAPHSTIEATMARADDGRGLPVRVVDTAEVRSHQAVLRVGGDACTDAMGSRVAYSIRYRGARDGLGHVDTRWRSQTVLAPEGCAPFRPIADREPPQVIEVVASDLTEIVVRFDERIDPATAARISAYSIASDAGEALELAQADVLSDRAGVRITTAPQRILVPYTITVRGIADAADPPNVLSNASVSFVGFGELDPPFVERVRAIADDRILVRFNEPLDPDSALDTGRYGIAGLSIADVAFSGDPGRRALAFNPALAPRVRNAVLLTTSPMAEGVAYSLTIDGVRDLSGNPSADIVTFDGVAEAPRTDVVLEYEISNARPIAGNVPSRAISLAELAEGREGVFVLGARAGPDHAPVSGREGPVNDVLGGFGQEGLPLEGIEPKLLDSGRPPDLVAGDGVFSIAIPGVPLGATMIWKAFAPFTTAYRDANPGDAFAAFADALPGPSVFADGQEFPGNENGVVVLDDGSSDGVVRLRCLFGDEITYKKYTGSGAYVWVVDDR